MIIKPQFTVNNDTMRVTIQVLGVTNNRSQSLRINRNVTMELSSCHYDACVASFAAHDLPENSLFVL